MRLVSLNQIPILPEALQTEREFDVLALIWTQSGHPKMAQSKMLYLKSRDVQNDLISPANYLTGSFASKHGRCSIGTEVLHNALLAITRKYRYIINLTVYDSSYLSSV